MSVVAAAIDAGSNSIRLLVAAIDGRGRPIGTIAAERRTTRLGTGLDRTGRLDPGAVESSLAVFREYAGICLGLGASWVTAAGTAAIRDALDGPEFIDRVRRETGLAMTAVSQADEAVLSLRGAAGVIGEEGPAALIDIGGRSTELIVRGGIEAPRAYGLPLGVVRLLDEFPLSDPPRPGERPALEEAVNRVIGEARLPGSLAADALLAGTGGTFAQLASLDLRLERYDPGRIDGHRLDLAALEAILGELTKRSLGERRTLPGMEPDRADVIIHGAVVARALVRKLGRDGVTVCDADILAGLLPAALEGFARLSMTPVTSL
jgi:exopolyphosphatase/guanosine-5'-triphosphate,3'-diphosphate pyrophosphatase